MEQNPKLKRKKYRELKKQSRKRRRFYFIDESIVKTSWDELLYDLIFIIVISKLSEMFIESASNMSFGYLVMEISIFIMIFWMWFRKVMISNNMHVLSKKLHVDIHNYKLLTYLELTVLILLFYQMGTEVNKTFYLIIVLLVIVFGMLSMQVIRTRLIRGYSQNKEELLNAFFIFKRIHISEVNISHILERFGIVMILFLGEILSTIFNFIDNWIVLLLSIIIIFNTFSANIRLINALEEKIKGDNEVKLIKVINYFRTIFIILLLIILQIEYMKHYDIKSSLVLVLLLVLSKLFQRYNLLKINVIWINIYEIISFLYFIFVITLVYYFRFVNYYTIILILLLVFSELFRNGYYKRCKEKVIENA